jgi:hypothetical protein
MLRERADDLVDLAATQQVDRAPVAEVWIDAVRPLARPRSSEDPLGLGEDELESVYACCVRGIGSTAAHPPGETEFVKPGLDEDFCRSVLPKT